MDIPKKAALIKIEFTEEEGTWYATVFTSVRAQNCTTEEPAYVWESVEQLKAADPDELRGLVAERYPDATQTSPASLD